MVREGFVTATDVMKFLYCPRIIYFIYVLKSPQAVTFKETKGLEKYQQFKTKSKRNKIIKEFPKMKRLYDVTLFSDKLKAVTKTDCILIDENANEAYPIQIKFSKKPIMIYKSQRYQLFFEALLIEEQFGYNVPFGFIKFTLSKDLVKIDLNNKTHVLDVISDLREIISKENFPPATKYRKRCVDCCYRKKCWLT